MAACARTRARRRRAAELDAGVLREDEVDVLRIVVLAGDEQDLLDPAGDDQLAVAQRAQVAGIEEAVGGARRLRSSAGSS